MVKTRLPELLRAELSSPKWQPQLIAMSGITDCYQPVERKLKLTRRCLEVLAEFRNPVGIITKNLLVTRDIDVLSELAKYHAVSVCLSVTTLDNHLRSVMEPRTSPPQARLAAIRKLAEAGIPVSVNVAPIIPGLTDHEIPKNSQGRRRSRRIFRRIHDCAIAVRQYVAFREMAGNPFPGSQRQKSSTASARMRGGKLYEAQWGKRMSGEGIFADQIETMFDVAYRKGRIQG